jgi:hypothetical protein
MDLLCVLEQGKALPVADVNALAKKYNINEVMKVAITQDMGAEWMSILNPQFQNLYLEFMPTNDDVIVEKTVTDLYKSMELFFEKMNIKFQEKYKGGIITEGSVWHYGEDENHMLKCKALSVREGHIKQACGIPHEDIRKAIRKLEENSDEDLATQKIDKILSFVKDELLEEYDKQMVDDDKTEQKVKSVLGKYLKKVKIDDEMQQIVDRIHNEIGVEASPADKMRVFAELYPNMRKRSGTVYQALVSM